MNKGLIQQFIDQSIVAKSDYQLLDIQWIFSYSLPGKTAYQHHKVSFKRWLGTTCRRCLEKKYNLPLTQFREKMNSLTNLLNSDPDFLSYETYYDDSEFLDQILMANTSAMLITSVEQRMSGSISSELESKILSFILNCIPTKIKESEQKAADFRAANPNNDDKYMWLPGFHIRQNRNTGEISYFIIDLKEWTYLFNKMFDKELKEFRFKLKSSSGRPGLGILLPYETYDEHSFWQFGDELVKLGLGYWIASLSSKGNVSLEFIIPNFIYNAVQPFQEYLPKIEGMPAMVSNIQAEKKEAEWSLGEVTNTLENVSDFFESEIEDSIASNPDILEDNLEVIKRQFPTDVGLIDVLCKDTVGDFVVVELKKGAGSFEVVGQIQKYMAWIDKHYAGTKQVRGIIVAKENDKQLEYAAMGSKFAIDIKVFGEEAPILANIKYCENCGKPNKKSAKYCVKCGNESWM